MNFPAHLNKGRFMDTSHPIRSNTVCFTWSVLLLHSQAVCSMLIHSGLLCLWECTELLCASITPKLCVVLDVMAKTWIIKRLTTFALTHAIIFSTIKIAEVTLSCLRWACIKPLTLSHWNRPCHHLLLPNATTLQYSTPLEPSRVHVTTVASVVVASSEMLCRFYPLIKQQSVFVNVFKSCSPSCKYCR